MTNFHGPGIAAATPAIATTQAVVTVRNDGRIRCRDARAGIADRLTAIGTRGPPARSAAHERSRVADAKDGPSGIGRGGRLAQKHRSSDTRAVKIDIHLDIERSG
jgi:hypothetical protein